jgi:hypothetical protein
MAAAARRWNSGNPEKRKAMKKRHYEKHRDSILARHKAYHALHRDKNNAMASIRGKKYREEMRTKALHHYAGDPPRCACCGEKMKEFLCFDHINGGGAKQREERGHLSLPIWLVKNGLPDGFQVLCHNCNSAKHIYGVCPHQQVEAQPEK